MADGGAEIAVITVPKRKNKPDSQYYMIIRTDPGRCRTFYRLQLLQEE